MGKLTYLAPAHCALLCSDFAGTRLTVTAHSFAGQPPSFAATLSSAWPTAQLLHRKIKTLGGCMGGEGIYLGVNQGEPYSRWQSLLAALIKPATWGNQQRTEDL